MARTLYAMEQGDSVMDFLADLDRDDPAEHAAIWRRLEQLAQDDGPRRADLFRGLGDGLFEARTRGGSRVIFFHRPRQVVICAVAYPKRSEKAPRTVLRLAADRKREYERTIPLAKNVQVVIGEGQDRPRRMPA
ncbi:MAG: hypothetical protein BWK77_02580 [Verrucomicrobia bacterium A1]|nr:MAG: hypothetical protein BWK77_02580 [Verrucomicrobia bacterium A1]